MSEQLLLDFQLVMEQFLETQARVLTAYLSSGARSSAPNADSPASVTELPAPERGSVDPVDPRPLVRHDSEVPDVAPATVVAEPGPPNAAAPGLVRLIVRATSRPAPGARASLAPDHAVLITDDGTGVAAELARRLRLAGQRVAILAIGSQVGPLPDSYASSFESLADVEQVLHAIVASCGPIAAVVHLLPLSPIDPHDDLDPAWSRARLRLETRSLFLLSQAVRLSLQTAAGAGGAALIAVTGMGGAFGSDAAYTSASFSPGQGGVVGLTKCLALEWADVRIRAVDLDTSEHPEVLAGQIDAELWSVENELEIGYAKGRRLGLELAAVPARRDPAFDLPSDAVVLATGGARGITAEVCLELAERCQPTFILVGQTALPDSLEHEDTATFTSPVDLKRALIAQFRKNGSKVTPAEVEKACQQILREREIRDNVGRLTASGARVHYVKLDVRDDDALAVLIREVYATYERLDGVIHGAGIIEDKLVQHKSIESFDRVLETKTRSAFVLAKNLRPETLRFAVFFSSVAGRFGNRGQADYAAANEVVNKLAVDLSGRWPARVCSINWAPWDKRGMVSPELKREFAQRGVELIDPRDGRGAFWEEIQQRPTDRAEVVIAASSKASLLPGTPQSPVNAPLLKHATRRMDAGGAMVYLRTLDPGVDCYLDDHRLDGRGVLPLAFATELMAEAAESCWPDLSVVAVRSLQLLKGISLDAASVPLEIRVRMPVHGSDGIVTTADVEIATPSLSPALRYRAVVDLAPRPDKVESFTLPERPLPLPPLPLKEAYRQWTFHGPLFRRLTSIDGLGSDAMRGGIYSSSMASGVRDVARAQWVIDPFVFDAALQMLLIWSRAQNDKTALPSRFRAFRRFGSLSDVPLTCHVQVESVAGGHAIRSDVHFVGPDGAVLGVLEGMEASCSAELNRLSGS